ncbi:metal regulatory transcription factor 1 [Strongylocentrotus purpuratus]|uniref:C2H2-type domain-containing protein n=1 Tax=Strongylocentrotus purpuratus TaxID=7668 RepID=A0A7M7PRL9_STRPU|nr:metal regulatory transcription factor 1 [Strongylocentrotus purpuratus]XP_030855244.1 metal regulatory transcription factor 1 [Strongylocentrotus purpuratus]XP_030855245.1 metal regulatory transcription factor 1 [Strongylocentrotus purpuratus]
MAASGSSLSQFPGVHHHLKVEHRDRDQDSPSSVMTNSYMHSTNCMADTPSSALVEPDPHSLLSSSLTVPQSSLTVNDHDSTIDSLHDDGSDLHGDDFSQQLGGCGDESDTLDALSSLALQQSSLFLVNLPTRAQAPLGSLGGATTSFMPLLVIGGGMQKGGEGAQFLRLRDIAHANLICATQESIARTYNAPTPKQVEKREHKCEQCGRIFKSSSHFRYHMETHKGNKMLKCPVNGCNRSFSWPANLKYHIRTHANDRPYPCGIEGCGKTFFTVQALNVHSRIHTGTKPFKCTHDGCDKSFTTQGNLKNHFRIHTGERPFDCDFDGCTQRFAEMSSLKKHKLTHTGKSRPGMKYGYTVLLEIK